MKGDRLQRDQLERPRGNLCPWRQQCRLMRQNGQARTALTARFAQTPPTVLPVHAPWAAIRPDLGPWQRQGPCG